MNIKMNWLKSLAVAAVVAMASANASAVVVAAVTASGHVWLVDAPLTIPGMTTPAFTHPGGQVVATYSAECYAAEGPPASNSNLVDVDIVVLDTTLTQVAAFSPSQEHSAFCSSGGAPGTFSMTGVANLPRGTYRVLVRGRFSEERASGWMGARSLVVLR
ncbi:hypothetical protein [Rhizobacter sp. Root1221]|uniref:hypothetical protein n=1 Tax=Rhizobacter sp. Root1221 TaxID=1736433 RepID=UPI0012FCDF02|nr:hypothetical protein [Rhizobacter sp. Root1221]